MAKRLSQREISIFLICLVLIVGWGGYYFGYKPLQEQKEDLETQLQAKTQKYNKNLKVIQKSKALESEFNSLKSRFKQSGSNEQEMSTILSQIQRVAGQLNLSISDSKPKQVQKKENFNIFSVSMSIDSDITSVMEFIHTLQKEPYYFNVDEFYFEKGFQQSQDLIKSRLVLSKMLIP